MRLKGVIASLALVMGALCFGGCAMSPHLGGTDYGVYTARSAMKVNFATVVAIGHGNIHLPPGSGGPQAEGAGVILGALVGSAFGGGTGKLVATLAGALGGATVAHHVAAGNSVEPALVLTLKLDHGRTIAVTQSVSGSARFHPGERVEVLQDDQGTVRVIPAPPRRSA